MIFRAKKVPGLLSIAFQCPGCRCLHGIDPNRWYFNGDFEKPTITPSILTRSGEHMKEVCHSFVTDGKIRFLNDCTHELAGQTVDLPEVDS